MKSFKFIFALLLAVITITASAQISKDQEKERQKIIKLSEKKLCEKAKELSDGDVETYKKDGWKTIPYVLPLEIQIEAMHRMQMEYNDDLFPKYIMAEAHSINQDYDAANNRSLELAKPILVNNIKAEVIALIESAVAKEKIEAREGEYVIKSIDGAIAQISDNLDRFIHVVELYRIPPSKSKEVRVIIACTDIVAKKAVKKAIQKDLERETEKLQKKLDALLRW